MPALSESSTTNKQNTCYFWCSTLLQEDKLHRVSSERNIVAKDTIQWLPVGFLIDSATQRSIINNRFEYTYFFDRVEQFIRSFTYQLFTSLSWTQITVDATVFYSFRVNKINTNISEANYKDYTLPLSLLKITVSLITIFRIISSKFFKHGVIFYFHIPLTIFWVNIHVWEFLFHTL